MLRNITAIIAISIAAALAGCATGPTVTSETVIVAGIGPVTVEQMNVEIVDVDRDSRIVRVSQGRNTWPVDVPEVFGDLMNINAGDQVQIRRVEGAVVGVRPARRGAQPGIVYSEMTTGASFQNLPEKFVVRTLTLTARFENFDPATRIVNYEGPLGPRTHMVVDPAIQTALKRMKRGDMVQLTFAEGFHFEKR